MRQSRGHTPSGSMVVAIAALVVALSGTAVAASSLANGDKLIRKNSLSGNRLRNHTVTGKQINLSKLGKVPNAEHAESATNATSAGHATTADSSTNAGHATTAASATNAGHATTADSATNATFANAAGTTLASGQTLRGMWAISTVATAPGQGIDGAVGFNLTLPSTPTVQVVASGSAPPNCPGSSSSPAAAAGYLCVYKFASGNIASLSICSLGVCPGAEPWGFQLTASTIASGVALARGSYAVTAS